MAGTGSPDIPIEDAQDLRIGIVAARWHAEATDALLAGALRALGEAGIEQPTVLRVPGTFELAVAAGALAERGYDAVVALGVVVRGGTPHFDYVCQAATVGLTEVSVRHGIPIGFGVLTCDTEQQAYDRAGLPGSREDKGYDAALAAVSTALTLHSLRPERIP
ncbi:MAG: 6,7-dimethyl-8-ribityllumazine synthase [Sporichthyaceae bacterium]|nr:6,7-dimethyl-8-ribityllumazine synthase [Sporichthyaceae bacterium]